MKLRCRDRGEEREQEKEREGDKTFHLVHIMEEWGRKRSQVSGGVRWMARRPGPEGRGGEEKARSALVRGLHSTDNVTFFNPRFTLFALRPRRESNISLGCFFLTSSFCTFDISPAQFRHLMPSIYVRLWCTFCVRSVGDLEEIARTSNSSENFFFFFSQRQ